MNGSQKVIVHIAWAVAFAGLGIAYAQVTTPAAVNGCVYNATPPTLTDKQTVPFQCDVNGNLLVK